jgi:hypothetical protein
LTYEAPRLTEEIKSRNLTGDVITRCIITESGALEDCCVAQALLSSGSRGDLRPLGEQVLMTVRNWRYTPAVWQGKPYRVPYFIRIKIGS